MNPGKTTLRLHIDRLTLHGGTRADARRILAAIEQRLSELVNAGSEPARFSSSRMASIDGGAVRAGASPVNIGSHIAQRIFRGLSGDA